MTANGPAMSTAPVPDELYDQALKIVAARASLIGRDRFQRLMRVGFVTCDRLLIRLAADGAIKHQKGTYYRCYPTRAQWLLATRGVR